MKAKMILFMMIVLFLLGGMGCEKEFKYEIYENHEITACGVKDPLNSIEWLAKAEKDPKSLISIGLYKNIHSEENYFAFHWPNELGYTSSNYYDCNGKLVFGWNSVSSPGESSYEKFFSDKEFVTMIWEVKK